MKKVVVENHEYEIIEDYGDCFDKEEFIFYTSSDKKKKFEDLHNLKDKVTKIIDNIEYIKYNNSFYCFENACNITFHLPNSIIKNIYVSNNNQIKYIKYLYPNHQFLVKNEGDSQFSLSTINMKNKIQEIKIEFSVLSEDEYNKANSFLNINEKIPLADLSLIFEEYLDDKYIIKQNPNFKLTTERKSFYKALNEELNKDNFIAICGPKGMGKSTNILAFLRGNLNDSNYFYINAKIINKYLMNNDSIKVKELIIKEIYHSGEFNKFKEKINELDKAIAEASNALELLLKIITINFFKIMIIVIDQYKVSLDPNYTKLIKIKSLAKEKMLNIIVISSMNETDVKNSIVSSLSKSYEIKKAYLDYYYINFLVCYDDEEFQNLNQEEKKILQEYGNSYNFYYKILKERVNCPEGLKFEIFFDDKICEEFTTRFKSYYDNDEVKISKLINYLLKEVNTDISIKEFIPNSALIPIRFCKFSISHKNIFKLSSLNQSDDKIRLNIQSNKYMSFLLDIYKTICSDKEKTNKFVSNFQADINSIKLESSFSFLLWSIRFSEKKLLYNVNIIDFKLVNELFNLKKDDINFSVLKEKNESILLKLRYQNAEVFDSCIITLIDKEKNEYALYLFQVTRKKQSQERLTILSINDFINFLII